MEEAQLGSQLSLSQGLAYDPAEFRTGASPLCGSSKDGFVFSNAEINRAIDRNNRLKAARQADLTPCKPAANQSAIARAA